MSVWCLAGEEKTRFAWHWGRERVANRLKKSAMKTGFSGSGIYDRESGFQSNTGARFQIESMHGKRVPKILQRLRQKKIQLWGDIKDFENFPTEVKKILRKKAQWPLLLVAASPTWAIFKVKILLYSERSSFLILCKDLPNSLNQMPSSLYGL